MTIATWDTADDWSLFTTSGTEMAFTRAATPADPWRGGAGRVTDIFTTPGTTTWYAQLTTPVNRRCLRAQFKMRVKDITVTAEKVGPIEVHAKDPSGTNLDYVGHTTLTSGGFGGGSFGDGLTLNLDNDWHFFDVACISLGEYPRLRVSQTIKVYKLARGSRPLLVLADSLSVAPGIDLADVYRYTSIRIGIRGMIRATDSVDIFLDECTAKRTSSTSTFMNARNGPRSPWPVTI